MAPWRPAAKPVPFPQMIGLTETFPASLLDEQDFPDMLRLVSEAGTRSPDHLVRKKYLMSGLCELVEASKWTWALGRNLEPGKHASHTAFEQDGFAVDEFARFLVALEHPDMIWMNSSLSRELKEKRDHVTRAFDPIQPDSRFPSSAFLELWQKAGIGPAIASIRPLDDGTLSGIGLYRPAGAAPFCARQTRIAHLVLSSVSWLHESGWPTDLGTGVSRLYPRQRAVLNLLLQGHNRQFIADHLSISVNTVSGYVKAIYRHFDVQSHATLIRRFQTGRPDHVL